MKFFYISLFYICKIYVESICFHIEEDALLLGVELPEDVQHMVRGDAIAPSSPMAEADEMHQGRRALELGHQDATVRELLLKALKDLRAILYRYTHIYTYIHISMYVCMYVCMSMI